MEIIALVQKEKSFSSPHGDFFILTTINILTSKVRMQFSSPHGDFFILTEHYNCERVEFLKCSRPLMGISLY